MWVKSLNAVQIEVSEQRAWAKRRGLFRTGKASNVPLAVEDKLTMRPRQDRKKILNQINKHLRYGP